MLWRLYVCQERLARAKQGCAAINIEANKISTLITNGEIENETCQKELVQSVEKAASLKAVCAEAEDEQKKLQQLWESTQPELMLAVLVELHSTWPRWLSSENSGGSS